MLVDVGLGDVDVVGEAGQRPRGDVAGRRVGERGVVAAQQVWQVDTGIAGSRHRFGPLGVREGTQHLGRVELSSPHQFLGRSEVLDVEDIGHSRGFAARHTGVTGSPGPPG